GGWVGASQFERARGGNGRVARGRLRARRGDDSPPPHPDVRVAKVGAVGPTAWRRKRKTPAAIAGASSSWECDQAGIIRGSVTLAGGGAARSSSTRVQSTPIVAMVRPIAA